MSSTQQLLLTEGGGATPNYIEDVFSTYLYTGNGSTQTITNNIDLSTKGGMTWVKGRAGGPNSGADNNFLFDTVRGNNNYISSNQTQPQNWAGATSQLSFGTSGFSVDASGLNGINTNNETTVSWSFRKQSKFFDVVTYTGTGSAQSIAHTLGATPGFVIVKRTDTTGAWYCNITVFGGSDYLLLNSTAARTTDSSVWNNTAPTSTVFTVGTNSGVNASGGTYVAYLFANNAGGFGLTGTDSVISSGLISSAGSGNTTVDLGWEPQFLLFKKTASASDWFIYDTMRGMAYATGAATLLANTSGAETTGISVVPTATGFVAALDNSFTYFCIAIRRGPMKVPTDATKVFSPVTRTGTGATAVVTTPNFVVDSAWIQQRTSGWQAAKIFDRLRGATNLVYSNTTSAEVSDATTLTSFASNVGFTLGDDSGNYSVNVSGQPYINWAFSRAPSFFDEVCYTGTGSATTFNHNLGAVPELMIVKERDSANPWRVYSAPTAATTYLALNTTAATTTSSAVWNDTTPTSSVFTVGTSTGVNGSGGTYVAYLFATCAGVSKVGTYTGNGSTQTINCGFAGGARFVLIKRTDSTGDWYVYDTARGMTTLTDPYLLLNSTAAEVATLGSVTTVTTGFAVNASILAAINTNAASYVFFAVA